MFSRGVPVKTAAAAFFMWIFSENRVRKAQMYKYFCENC